MINTSSKAEVSDADKERFVVMGYKEYAAEHHPSNPDSGLSPEVQTYKYLMYIGWSFRELSIFLCHGQSFNDFYELLFAGSFLYNAAKMLEADGYPDPASNPFYYSFKVDVNKFPVRFMAPEGVEVFDYSRQPEIFRVVYFDRTTSYITFKTPLYITEDVLERVFHPQSQVTVSQYDKTEKQVYSEISPSELAEQSKTTIDALLADNANVNKVDRNELQITEKPSLEWVFERKHISDYPQVSEIIKDLCLKLAKNPDKEARAVPSEIRFDDLEVVVGPWSELLQCRGGYYSVDNIKKATGGKTEFEPVPGFKVTAPVIIIDNLQAKTVGDRTSTIIHEYRHHINVQLWVDSPEYENPGDAKDEEEQVQRTVKYLTNPQERLAHKTQFKYMLSIGISKEQILRNRLGRKPTIKDIPYVKEYLSIINEASKELEEESREEEKMEDVKEEAKKKVDMFDPSTFSESTDDMTVG